ncbi:probable phospholipase A1 magnifin isoform X2 [Planococcus citri]
MKLDLPVQDLSQLHGRKISNERPLVFIIHGFQSDTSEQWMKDLAQAYLQSKDGMVFAVDWGSNAKTVNYWSSANQVPIVANQLIGFINMLMTQFGVETKKIHIIGHSLGAHIAGNVGRGLPSVYRITGLDPAGPKFQVGSLTTLRKTDAYYVDVLHTCRVLGHRELLGTVDFFINENTDEQPACAIKGTAVRVIAGFLIDSALGIWEMTCSHSIVTDYFIESLKNQACRFVASKTIERAKKVTSDTLDPNLDTTVLGLDTFKYKATGKLHVITGAFSPYCRTKPS